MMFVISFDDPLNNLGYSSMSDGEVRAKKQISSFNFIFLNIISTL